MLKGIARQRKLTVALVIVVFLGLGLCLNTFIAPVYLATVRIEFPRPADRTPWTGQLGESGGFQSDNQSFYTTAELITSRAMRRGVMPGASRPSSARYDHSPRPRSHGAMRRASHADPRADWVRRPAK